jgi:acetylornithine deacetylase
MRSLSLSSEKVKRWADSLAQLARLESVFEHEHEAIRFVEERLHALGISVQSVHFDPERLRSLAGAQPPISHVAARRNLIARIPGNGSGRSLVLNCHLDVVPAGDVSGWKHPPFAAHIDHQSNVIYGRGVWDDKAGVAIALGILEEFAEAPLDGDLVVQFVLEDETTGNGTLLCLEDGHVGDAAIILDGTRLDRGVEQHAGNLRFSVEVTGKPASVSVSHVGINAAEKLMDLLQLIKAEIFGRNAGRPEPWTIYPSPNQFITQSFHSEGVPLTVPERARAECYVTYTPPDTLQTIRTSLNGIVAAFIEREGIPSAKITFDGHFATEPVSTDCEALKDVLQAAAELQGWPAISFGPSTGTSDLRHFAQLGIPCVLYGPGRGFNPHRADEHYYLDDLPAMVSFLAVVIDRWCNKAKGAGG